MERIWLKQYPAGVPADIDVTQYSSLVELLEESFAKFNDRKAFICMDKAISYRDLDEMSLASRPILQGKGLQKGARVALMMPNVLQYPVCDRGRAARRLRGGQRQSALHAARTRTPVEGFRRRGDHRAGEFRDQVQQVTQDRGEACHHRQMGDCSAPRA